MSGQREVCPSQFKPHLIDLEIEEIKERGAYPFQGVNRCGEGRNSFVAGFLPLVAPM